MLSKELMLGGARKKNGPVIMTVGKRVLTGEYPLDAFGFYKADSMGAINVTPYWWINGEKARLLALAAYYSSGSSSVLDTICDIRGENTPSAGSLELTITANGRTGKITIPTSSNTLMSYGVDVFALRSLVGQQVKLDFAPPPQTGIYRRCQRHLLRGGGVNARERSTTAFDEKERADAEHTQWVGRCDGDHVLQRQDIYELERFRFSISESKNPHFIAGGGRGDLRRRSVGRLWAELGECQDGRGLYHTHFLHCRPNQRRGNSLVVSCFEGGANA